MSARASYWGLFAVTFAIYGAMVLWTLPAISQSAGGLPAFDMRPGGYDLEAARSFLSALGPEGRAVYAGPQRILDSLYPALLGAVLVFAILKLFPAGLLRNVVVVFPVIGAIADYVENIKVAGLLQTAVPDLTAEAVTQASRWTLIKSGSTTIAMIAVAIALLVLLGRRFISR